MKNPFEWLAIKCVLKEKKKKKTEPFHDNIYFNANKFRANERVMEKKIRTKFET